MPNKGDGLRSERRLARIVAEHFVSCEEDKSNDTDKYERRSSSTYSKVHCDRNEMELRLKSGVRRGAARFNEGGERLQVGGKPNFCRSWLRHTHIKLTVPQR